MPGPTPIPVESDARLPERVDVVVIGGGIIGAATALELAERGVSVCLCEKGVVGGEQSGRNWGWVRISRRDPREIPLMCAAIDLWSGYETRLARKTGYRKTGILFTFDNARTGARYERWSRHLAPYQMACGVIGAAELDGLAPGHRMTRAKGALYTPADGRAEPQWAAPAVAEGARARGASILTGCAVRVLDLQAGRVCGVVTERGRIRCDSVVLAGGAWSRLFAGNLGIDLPQLRIRNTVLRTTPVEGGPEASVWARGFALRRRADGGYTVADGAENVHGLSPDSLRLARAFWPALRAEWRSLRFRLDDCWRAEAAEPRRWTATATTAFERCRVLDPAPSERTLTSSWAAARRAFPVLEKAEVAQSWAGMIDVTPDALPVISGVAQVPGVYIATGFSGHGFGIGPGAGRLMADLVTGADPVVDPHDFRFARFTDGSAVKPQSGY